MSAVLYKAQSLDQNFDFDFQEEKGTCTYRDPESALSFKWTDLENDYSYRY